MPDLATTKKFLVVALFQSSSKAQTKYGVQRYRCFLIMILVFEASALMTGLGQKTQKIAASSDVAGWITGVPMVARLIGFVFSISFEKFG